MGTKRYQEFLPKLHCLCLSSLSQILQDTLQNYPKSPRIPYKRPISFIWKDQSTKTEAAVGSRNWRFPPALPPHTPLWDWDWSVLNNSFKSKLTGIVTWVMWGTPGDPPFPQLRVSPAAPAPMKAAQPRILIFHQLRLDECRKWGEFGMFKEPSAPSATHSCYWLSKTSVCVSLTGPKLQGSPSSPSQGGVIPSFFYYYF